MGMAGETILSQDTIKKLLADTQQHLDKRPFDLKGAELSNRINHIAWPESIEQINPTFTDDIASKVSKATGASIDVIKEEILAEIMKHYKKG